MWKHTARWRDGRLKNVGAAVAEVALTWAQTQLQGTALTLHIYLGQTFPLPVVIPSLGRCNG